VCPRCDHGDGWLSGEGPLALLALTDEDLGDGGNDLPPQPPAVAGVVRCDLEGRQLEARDQRS
jgi:hypothetical protein